MNSHADENGTAGLHIAAMLGSVRPNNHTGKALEIALAPLRAQRGVTCDVLDPADFALALPGQPGAEALEQTLRARLAPADAVVLATPEYHGSYSSTLKVLLDNTGYPSELAGKPIALLGVASGQLGAVKSLEHLRSVCSHIGALVLPYPVSVPLIDSVFDEAGACVAPGVQANLEAFAARLYAYLTRGELHPATYEGSASAVD